MRPCLAAFVGLAFAASSNASIVYVPNGASLWEQIDVTQPPPHGVPIDVNVDGVLDLGFYVQHGGGIPPGYIQIDWYDDATGGSGYSVSALAAGGVVGPGTGFTASGTHLGSYVQNFFQEPPHYEYSGALYIPQGNSYWGLKFVGPGGAVSYGWLQFYGFNNVTRLGGGSVTIQVVDYAYETQPGVPIVVGAVPAPGAMGALGLCGLAFSARRRRGHGRRVTF